MENKNIFIGRQKELEILHEAYKEASSGKGKLLLVEGSAGVGKSGLVREFLRQIESDKDAIIGISECDDKENLNAYAPFKDILIELNISQHKKGKRKNIINFFKEAGTSWVELIPVIGTYAKVGIETFEAGKKYFKGEAPPNIESENDIFRIFENEFRRLAEDKTVVVFIDDLQWADSSSLNLIFGLGKAIRGNPFNILLIGSYRYNEVKAGRNKISETGDIVTIAHPFEDKLNMLRTYTKPENHIDGNSNWFQEINLKPFDKDKVKDLINKRFPNNQFSTLFSTDIFDITDGHPLFVVEILGYLMKEGIIVKKDNSYVAQKIKLDELPTSIDGVITEKVARLNKELLKILTYASINGEEFAFEIIEKVLNVESDDDFDLLEENLQELNKIHGILFEENNISDTWGFSQTLVHKFVYKNMSNLKRKRLHKKIAFILKEINGEEIETDKELKDKYNLHVQIGQGLIDGVSLLMTTNNTNNNAIEESDSDEEIPTSQLFLDAASTEIEKAKDSFELFAMDESISFVDKALAFLSKTEDENTDKIKLKFEALFWRNKTLEWQGHHQNALDTANKMIRIAALVSNKDFSARANLAVGLALISLANNIEALVYLEKAIRYYQTTENISSLWKATYEAGFAHLNMSSFDRARDLLEKALELSEQIEDKNFKGRTLSTLGNCYSFIQKEGVDTMDFFNKALTIFKETKNQYGAGMIYKNIGLEYLRESDESESLKFLEKALQIAKEQNDFVNISTRLDNISLVYASENEYNKALEYSKKSLAINTRLDDKPSITSSLSTIGMIYGFMEEYEKALDFQFQSLEMAKILSNQNKTSSVYFQIYYVYQAMENEDKAIEYIFKSIEIDKKIDDKPSLAITLSELGRFYKDSNNYEKAILYYQESLNNYIATGDKSNQSLVNENLAEIYYDLKQYEIAIELFKEAINIAEELDKQSFLTSQYTMVGLSFYWLDKYDKANEYFLKSIGVISSIYGEKSKELAIPHNHIGNSYLWNEQYEHSIENHKKALDIRNALFEEDSFEVDESRYGLALAYNGAGEHEKAKKLFSKTLIYRKKVYGEDNNEYIKVKEFVESNYSEIDVTLNTGSPAPDHDVTLLKKVNKLEISIENEVKTYFENGNQSYKNADYSMALDQYQEALESCALLSDADINIKSKANIYLGIGEANRALKNYDIAIDNYIDAYNNYIKISDRDYADTAKVCTYLGGVYYFKKNYKEAIENHQEAVDHYIKAYGENNVMEAWSYSYLGEDYYKLSQYENSIKYFKKAIDIRTQLKGKEDKVVAEYYMFLGDSYYFNNDRLTAIEHYRTAYTIRKDLIGLEKDADVSLSKLAHAYYIANYDDKAKECLNTSLQFRKEYFGENSDEYNEVKKKLEENF